MKNIIIIILIALLAGFGVYFLTQKEVIAPEDNNQKSIEEELKGTSTDVSVPKEGKEAGDNGEEGESNQSESVIGTSAGGHDIIARHYGSGETELLFAAGIHGGYDWNTTLLAYKFIDYLEANPEVIPENTRVTIIPVLNPDGLNKVVGTTGRFSASEVPENTVEGRFNANNVDLNRNFDCDWQETGVWRDKSVDAGTKPFSEPEAQAFRDYVKNNNPDAVVVWYSAAGGVFASNCHKGIPEETQTITDLYADVSGYPAHQEFDFYEITGDAVNWLAKNNIPAISVLLSNHQDIEWKKNKAGIKAILNHYGE